MKHLHIVITDELYKVLKEEAHSKNASLGYVVREYLIGGVELDLPHFENTEKPIDVRPIIKNAVPKKVLEEFMVPAFTISCDMPFCKGVSSGKYKVKIQDDIEGSIVSEKNLCKFHIAKARREGSAEMI